MPRQCQGAHEAEHHGLVGGDHRFRGEGFNPLDHLNRTHISAAEHDRLGVRMIGTAGKLGHFIGAQRALPVVPKFTSDVGTFNSRDLSALEEAGGEPVAEQAWPEGMVRAPGRGRVHGRLQELPERWGSEGAGH